MRSRAETSRAARDSSPEHPSCGPPSPAQKTASPRAGASARACERELASAHRVSWRCLGIIQAELSGSQSQSALGSLDVWRRRRWFEASGSPTWLTRFCSPRLSDAKLEWLAKRGTRRRFEPGEVLYEHAERDAPFYVIERGLVEFIDRKPGKDVYVAQADSRTYIGDIAAFTGEPTISACVAVEPTDVIVFDRGGLRAMVARWPEFGEQVFATLLARQAWHRPRGTGSCG